MADTIMNVLPLSPHPTVSEEVVVIVPGLLAGRHSMRRYEERLGDAGYQTRRWRYPSLRGSISRHARRLSRDLRELAHSPHVDRIHLLTHSLGSVVARAAVHESGLEIRWPKKAGRFVMLAPPNGGSRLTRIPLGPFASSFPQLCELSESPDSFVRRLPPLQQMSVGVIAAENDFVVDLDATHLAGQRDHAVLPTTHQRLTSDQDAIEMSIRFLRTECFDEQPMTIPFHRFIKGVAQRRRVRSAAA